MIPKFISLLVIFAFFFESSYGQKGAIKSNKAVISLSAIKGTSSRADTLILSSDKKWKISNIKITGEQAAFFRILSPKTTQVSLSAPAKIVFVFEPPASFVGLAQVKVLFKGIDFSLNIYGLSTQALEGENEPPLARVVDALGLKINVGWNTLANHLRPELQGEELPPSLFKKAREGQVEMIPVARYSPDFPLNFGYYTQTPNGPVQHQTGILAKADKIPEHQTLFPMLAKGKTAFDPGQANFGFYALSPEHTLYSEDIWNMLFYPTHAAHPVRVYPVKDNLGTVIPNTFLLCMEEAANGDYNDYVFLVKNIVPVGLSEKFTSLFNGQDLKGWNIWLEGKGLNNDPDKNFKIQDGQIFDAGKDLGYIITEKSFGNFHFVAEFKWGEKRWPPRENAKRDSGICYNIPDDEVGNIWPQSVECQIQEGDVGDFWLLGYSTIQVEKKQKSSVTLFTSCEKQRRRKTKRGMEYR